MADTINFTETNAETISSNYIKTLEEKTGELLYPGDERRIYADAKAYAWAVLVSAANEQCKARLLKYAKGYTLDALGERYNCTRLPAHPASVKLSFTLATARPNDITIPAGTTVTADNKVLFATDAAATIKAGELEAKDITATATTSGTVTNGVPVGAIQTYVDKVPYVTGVVNTTVSSGGDDGEPYPLEIDAQRGDDGTGDDNYRERIKMAAAGFSCAGSAASYEYYARSASSNVEGVKVTSDQERGRVDIYITETGGVDPTEGTLEAVRNVLTSDKVRPLNDQVTVQAPAAVTYDIGVTYYVTQADESASVEAIEGAGGLIDKYNAWQQGEIGRDINPDRLRAFLLDSCVRLDVTAPSFTSVSDSEIARFSGTLNITHIIVKE